MQNGAGTQKLEEALRARGTLRDTHQYVMRFVKAILYLSVSLLPLFAARGETPADDRMAETWVVGQTVDSLTGRPVRVRARFMHSGVSRRADSTGRFVFHTLGTPPGQLQVSRLMYQRQRFDIQPGQVNELQILLSPFHFDGYIHAGPVDVGHVSRIVGYNSVEHLRLGLPLRTSGRLSDTWQATAYAAYGMRDRQWKAGLHIDYQSRKAHRMKIAVGGMDDYQPTDRNAFDNILRNDASTAWDMDWAGGLARQFDSDAWLNRCRQIDLSWSRLIGTCTTMSARLMLGKISYGDALATHAWQRLPGLDYQTLQLSATFDGSRLRTSDGTEQTGQGQYPRITIGVQVETAVVPEDVAHHTLTDGHTGRRTYAEIFLCISQQVDLGHWGQLDYLMTAGHFLGTPPDVRIHHFQGNRTWGYDRYRFSLMDRMQYQATSYAELHTVWNLQGCLLNRLRPLRRLHLHELVQLKAAIGDDGNHLQLDPRLTYSSSSLRTPHLEAGIGLGNILSIASVWYVHRLTRPDRTDGSRQAVLLQITL